MCVLILVKGGVRWAIYISFGRIATICEESRAALGFFYTPPPPSLKKKNDGKRDRKEDKRKTISKRKQLPLELKLFPLTAVWNGPDGCRKVKPSGRVFHHCVIRLINGEASQYKFSIYGTHLYGSECNAT